MLYSDGENQENNITGVGLDKDEFELTELDDEEYDFDEDGVIDIENSYLYTLTATITDNTKIVQFDFVFGNEYIGEEFATSTGEITHFETDNSTITVTPKVYDSYGNTLNLSDAYFDDWSWNVSFVTPDEESVGPIEFTAGNSFNVTKDWLSGKLDELELTDYDYAEIKCIKNKYNSSDKNIENLINTYSYGLRIYKNKSFKYGYVEHVSNYINQKYSSTKKYLVKIHDPDCNRQQIINGDSSVVFTQSLGEDPICNITSANTGNDEEYYISLQSNAEHNDYGVSVTYGEDYYLCSNEDCPYNEDAQSPVYLTLKNKKVKLVNEEYICQAEDCGFKCNYGGKIVANSYFLTPVNRGYNTSIDGDVSFYSNDDASSAINSTIESDDSLRTAITLNQKINSTIYQEDLTFDNLGTSEKTSINNLVDNNAKIAKTVDLSVAAIVNNDISNKHYLSDLVNNIVLKEDVSSLGNYDNFYVIRYHNGQAEKLNTQYDATNKTITFATNKFSDYAIVGVNNTTTPVATVTKPTLSKAGDTVVADNGSTVTLLSTGAVSVKMKNVSSKSVTVPTSVTVGGKTYKITTVKGDAFDGTKVTKVTLPKGITKLNAKTFAGDKKLTTIKVNSKKLTIGKNIFKGISKKQKAKIKVTVNKKNMSKKNFYALRKALMKQGIKYRNIKRK